MCFLIGWYIQFMTICSDSRISKISTAEPLQTFVHTLLTCEGPVELFSAIYSSNRGYKLFLDQVPNIDIHVRKILLSTFQYV